MDLREARQLTPAQEYGHWWIRTRFEYIDRALAGLEGAGLDVLEVGCGTGQNLRYLREDSPARARVGRVVGVDAAWAAGRERPTWARTGDQVARALDAVSGPFDLVLAMDVLEHNRDEAAVLAEWVARLKPGGRMLITVPAFAALWSRHDEVLGHFRRYTAGSLRRVARAAGLEPLSVRYAFGHVFPAVWVARKWVGPLRRNAGGTSDLQPAPAWLNRPLVAAGRWESAWGGNPFFGTSVIGLFGKGRA